MDELQYIGLYIFNDSPNASILDYHSGLKLILDEHGSNKESFYNNNNNDLEDIYKDINDEITNHIDVNPDLIDMYLENLEFYYDKVELDIFIPLNSFSIYIIGNDEPFEEIKYDLIRNVKSLEEVENISKYLYSEMYDNDGFIVTEYNSAWKGTGGYYKDKLIWSDGILVSNDIKDRYINLYFCAFVIIHNNGSSDYSLNNYVIINA